MPGPQFDRARIKTYPLKERENRVRVDVDMVDPHSQPRALVACEATLLATLVERIRSARATDAPVVMAFGAHTIKNGLAPVLIALMQEGWLTHLATNGAGIIHDWELAFCGETSEHVARNVAQGCFGNWEETGYMLNLALVVGAYEGRGYGESVGSLIENEGLHIPSLDKLKSEAEKAFETDPARAAAAIDLAETIRRFDLDPGPLSIGHPHRATSAQAAALRLGVPFTGHPMIGHDVIYNHAMNHGGALGRTALRDFLSYADSISRISGGVYLSIGSAVMSPMIFEKSISMGQNVAAQDGGSIENHFIMVVDLAESDWDWSAGEPPEDHPSYYLRYNKSFSRMGGDMRYLQMDNRDFLLHLLQDLRSAK
jgi:hypothetical protein